MAGEQAGRSPQRGRRWCDSSARTLRRGAAATRDIAVSSSGSVTFCGSAHDEGRAPRRPRRRGSRKSRPTSRIVGAPADPRPARSQPQPPSGRVVAATRPRGSSPTQRQVVRRPMKVAGPRRVAADHGADRQRQRPGDARDHPVHDDSDPDGGEDHQPGIGQRRIGHRLALKSISDVCNAAAYSSGGSSPSTRASLPRCASGTRPAGSRRCPPRSAAAVRGVELAGDGGG